jgi:hypothetical protein
MSKKPILTIPEGVRKIQKLANKLFSLDSEIIDTIKSTFTPGKEFVEPNNFEEVSSLVYATKISPGVWSIEYHPVAETDYDMFVWVVVVDEQTGRIIGAFQFTSETLGELLDLLAKEKGEEWLVDWSDAFDERRYPGEIFAWFADRYGFDFDLLVKYLLRSKV